MVTKYGVLIEPVEPCRQSATTRPNEVRSFTLILEDEVKLDTALHGSWEPSGERTGPLVL